VLRVALATSQPSAGFEVPVEFEARFVERDIELDPECPARGIARALERAFDHEDFRALAAATDASWPSRAPLSYQRDAVRMLFPSLEERVDEALGQGRRELAIGRLQEARRHFQAALVIDPEHMDARSFLAEVDNTLQLSEQIARAEPAAESQAEPPDWQELAPQLNAGQQRALELQLAEEKRLRDSLLATLALLGEEHDAPGRDHLARLSAGTILDPGALGPRRARAELQNRRAAYAAENAADNAADTGAIAEPNIDELSARALLAPDGSLIARYYFAAGSNDPLLLEEDSNADGRLDRWIAFRDGRRHAVWEERRGERLSNVHLVFAGDGQTLERIELSSEWDGAPERIFVYRDGRLLSEARDSSGDGRIDWIEHFDHQGRTALREEDLDSDGQIDVRTTYRTGRMIRREIMNPDMLIDYQ
jgi:hypothetical protein